MSIMIHAITKSGIIVGADTRTTCKNNGRTRYDDTSEKIVPFPNRLVVSYCGDMSLSKDLSIAEFLYDIRKKFGYKMTINELPLRILQEYDKQGGKSDTTFLISGYYEGMPYGCTYRICTKDKQITLVRATGNFGASYNGMTDIVHPIMNSDIDYTSLSVQETIDLVMLCVSTSIQVAKYWHEQGIGGDSRIYVIDRMHGESGWYKNNEIISDVKAPDDALIQYRKKQDEKFRKEIEKDIKRKGGN